ncbi:MAG TPA: hypothetical protein VGD21_11725 [Lysobacter sp.]
MNLINFSLQDQELIRAFFEIARDECGTLDWSEVEPVLASCWERTHRRSSELKWQDVAEYVRSACHGEDLRA